MRLTQVTSCLGRSWLSVIDFDWALVVGGVPVVLRPPRQVVHMFQSQVRPIALRHHTHPRLQAAPTEAAQDTVASRNWPRQGQQERRGMHANCSRCSGVGKCQHNCMSGLRHRVLGHSSSKPLIKRKYCALGSCAYGKQDAHDCVVYDEHILTVSRYVSYGPRGVVCELGLSRHCLLLYIIPLAS